MTERGIHQRQSEVSLPFPELLQRDAAPGNGKEMEVEAFRIPKQVFRLHFRVECINKTLCRHSEFLSYLAGFYGARRRLESGTCTGQPQPSGTRRTSKR